jgi:PAS domain S-box-containing protein
MAMVFMDATEPGNPIIFTNNSFLALTGYGRDEVLGQDFNFIMAHAADAEALRQIEAEFEGHSDGGAEILYRRKDGSEFWAALFISPVEDENGDVVQYFASFVDLSKHKDAQAQSKMLIDELNHCVKNTLSAVQSIVRQALQSGSDPNAIRASIESRLFASPGRRVTDFFCAGRRKMDRPSRPHHVEGLAREYLSAVWPTN